MPTKPITNITDGIVNTYIEESLGIVTNDLRNERVMETQRKQMHVRSFLNNAFLNNLTSFYIIFVDTKHGE